MNIVLLSEVDEIFLYLNIPARLSISLTLPYRNPEDMWAITRKKSRQAVWFSGFPWIYSLGDTKLHGYETCWNGRHETVERQHSFQILRKCRYSSRKEFYTSDNCNCSKFQTIICGMFENTAPHSTLTQNTAAWSKPHVWWWTLSYV